MADAFLTTIYDIDRDILLNLDDESLFNICKTNKYAAEIYNDDNFV